ncbi:16S rRNA (guanine(966)-N(2))-methyltransferase RsmD [Allobranchiibius sp. CTAmp26]|uniref:16S rRNA (guanine(966)-N(2))-methyltransferase RsmD n=1 Tax=Allobranchiibius sp. CTAmp26 TaxID=2815214 RepID=UPI001AA1BD9F|nr:16S rRNA (guanine(966)-N(2))-methyltransferase RsmD [Allobranchiibius sp. CTAmp26]MBO1756171.1 16S rRNA (guanine(966)-N(2))-methyltransferase RsmD [Allobranchiibius sp. CTAmp26]
MPRIVAGSARGRRITTPPGDGTRPTSDRVREALFGRLAHLGAVADAQVLDLYAGSGALGLEAVSRGARSALLVESDRRAAEVIRRNVAELGLDAQVRQTTVVQTLGGHAPHAMHLVLIDPPYAVSDDEVAEVLRTLVTGGWLQVEAVVVLERASRSPEPRWPDGLRSLESRAYGETTVWYSEYAPGDGASPVL